MPEGKEMGNLPEAETISFASGPSIDTVLCLLRHQVYEKRIGLPGAQENFPV